MESSLKPVGPRRSPTRLIAILVLTVVAVAIGFLIIDSVSPRTGRDTTAGGAADDGAALIERLEAEYAPKYAAAAQRLKQLLISLPDPSTVTSPSQTEPLSPVPEFGAVIGGSELGNTDYVDYHHALGLDTKGLVTLWDVRGKSESYGLIEAVKGRSSSMNRDLLKLAGGETKKRRHFQWPLDVRYVIVHRGVRYAPPKMAGSNFFVPGETESVVYLLDLSSGTVLRSTRVKSTNSEKISQIFLSGIESVQSDLGKQLEREFVRALERDFSINMRTQ